MVWTLRIRYDGSVQQLHEVDEEASFSALQQRIATVIGVPAEAISILAGFPPQPLDATIGGALSDAPVRSVPGLRNCTTLIVRSARAGSKSRVRSSRAASSHSTLAASSSSSSSSSTAAAQAQSQDAAAAAVAAHVRNNLPRRQRGTNKIEDALANDDSSSSSSSTRRTGRQTVTEEQLEAESWKSGLAEDIVRAVDGVEVTASLQNLRRSVKDMMLQAQAKRRALDREHAARAGTFEIGGVPGEFTLSGISRRFRVTFPVGRRKKTHEDYAKFPRVILQQVFRQLASHPDHRENLRIFNMALTSPSVFWNLVRLRQEAGSAAEGIDLEQFMMSLAPTLDWAFLDTRVRNLSEKALLNKQQADEQAAAKKQRQKQKQAKAKTKTKQKERTKAAKQKQHAEQGGGDEGESSDEEEAGKREEEGEVEGGLAGKRAKREED